MTAPKRDGTANEARCDVCWAPATHIPKRWQRKGSDGPMCDDCAAYYKALGARILEESARRREEE